MKLFLFTSIDSDNDPILVEARDPSAARYMAAVTGLTADIIDQQKADEPDMDDMEAYERALEEEEEHILQVYDVQEIEKAQMPADMFHQYGDYQKYALETFRHLALGE